MSPETVKVSTFHLPRPEKMKRSGDGQPWVAQVYKPGVSSVMYRFATEEEALDKAAQLEETHA